MKTSQKQIDEAIANLALGSVLIAFARIVANGKVELEFVENVQGLPNSLSLLAELNAGEAGFEDSRGAITRGWINAPRKAMENAFGFDLDEIEPIMYERSNGTEVEVYPLLIANPTASGETVHVQIQEPRNL